MTVPNILTILRILLTPLLVWLLMGSRLEAALIVFFVAGITDGLDGFIARAFHQKSRLGAFLDPVADKLLLVSSFVLLARIHLIPTWLAIITVSRDVIILLGVFLFMLNNISFEIRPSILSKLTTLSQIVTALVVMSSRIYPDSRAMHKGLFILTAALTVASGLHYIYRGFSIWEAHRIEEGL
ncbi:CDP-alcohol phosphatidyltransferase family protein [Thermodesulforhabdus norvegica]|uniref:CDP-diacylglycerol--glycerol-3-phosphate 3-phosphatidyltransferase n=1 Tax=Thermodesulforhabdus norvegica TaxID=39841 RepID=A0A1I4STS2_9BACT|nr:CDP-alcohol phosphatidyltransferase family protein [Thermodesulforhabdus norvegica]SFM67693.1 CDP-diacylglycerol--glycerol-3-phosphate 3-phosphatidyltransferase [Thermodesulforhabdus norvegica]